MSGYLNMRNRTAKVVKFPEGGKDGKTVEVKSAGSSKTPPKKIFSQTEKDLIYINSLVDVGETTDIDWQFAAEFVVDRGLVLDWALVDKFLVSPRASLYVKKFLVNEFIKEVRREFARRQGKFVGWHHANAHRVLKLVAWIFKDDLRYVSEVEELRALYDFHNTLFPESLEKRVKAKMENIAKEMAKREARKANDEPAPRRKKTCKSKPRLSPEKRAELKATRKERALARRRANDGKKPKGKGKGKGKDKGKDKDKGKK